jgi:nitrogen regulatory protein PII
MKLIVAIIRSDDLEAVLAAVEEAEGSPISASEIQYLRGRTTEFYRGAEYRPTRLRLRLEIVVLNDLLLQDVIESIGRAASRTDPGTYDGGDILVMDLVETVQLRTRRPARQEIVGR